MAARAQLDRAVAAGIISAAQAEALARFWAGEGAEIDRSAPPRGRFDVAHVLWYLGALVVIGAMGVFQTIAWTELGPGALALVAVLYAVVFTAAGAFLWHRRGLRVPGGLLVTIAVTMAPLAAYAAQDALGWWGGDAPGPYRELYRYIRGGWLGAEIAAVVASVVALRFFRFPFLLMPAAVALWFLSMDVAALIAGGYPDWLPRAQVSLGFGLILMVAGWLVDLRARADFGFWLHLFGGLAFWFGLFFPLAWRDDGWAAPALLSLALIALSVFLGRRVYLVLGGIGLFLFLGHLAVEVFSFSLLFPLALSAVGVGVIALGIVYHRRRDRVAAWLDRALPPALAALRPPHARARAASG